LYFRALIKPRHKKVNAAIRAHGIFPFIHCCEKCEELIPDFSGLRSVFVTHPSVKKFGRIPAKVGKKALQYNEAGIS